MIKAILIDDEEDARFMLRNKIESIYSGKINIVAEANSVRSGIKNINTYKPDLVFLDIQMNDGTGFDLLNQLADKDFEVIFVTAYNQYAIKAFSFSALGYLMKPIKTDDFVQAMDVILQHFSKYRSNSEKRLKVLVENYGDDRIKKIVIPSSKGFDVLAIDDIVMLEGDRNYTNFITKDKIRISASTTMGEYEALLNEYGFFRIHQSTIVNLRYVKGYVRGDGGLVEMTSGERLQLSRNRKNEFIKRFL